MGQNTLEELYNGFQTAYVNKDIPSDGAYKPQFVSNNYKMGKKVMAAIEDELLACDHFQISVAFITMGGITPLLQTLKELEKRNIKGEILTTNYQDFTQPSALKRLHDFKNITIRMYDSYAENDNLHTKGYIFHNADIFKIIIGSSNFTKAALGSNREWNVRIISTDQGEMAQEILEEFQELWNSKHAMEFDDFYEEYAQRYKIIQKQQKMARREPVPSIEKYRLQPNKMQVGFITNLKKIIASGEDRALLISATGTGKTYASAFAMRELGYKRVLFLVHRGQLARQTKISYERVFGNSVSMGLVGAGASEYDKDYVFATVQTLNKDSHLMEYAPDEFDCIILDEAHHSSADTYQKIMGYFSPRLWLGMTATPDKRDDHEAGKNIYEIFHYQIAYEIRLQQAMEENLLCTFHYFGVSDIALIDDKLSKTKKITERDFNRLTGDQRVQHIIEKAEFYGFSGERVKGLVFCSRIDESKILSEKFNHLVNPATGKYFRTIALNGDASNEQRQEAFERLAMNEDDHAGDKEPLDYIFSVEILNEGVDIVEVNQVIMLRPTQSPIVFIQQLGRGLRKAEGKEYVVILDFIGNYNNNFMIPIALSGDRTYNPDNIRKYIISGNTTIPGASSIHFDEIARERIFTSIDKIKGMPTIIRESYLSLKNRLGRVPYLLDFYENGEIDPLVIIREYKTYQNFLEVVEKDSCTGKISEQDLVTLEYLSKTILRGTRPYKLEIMKKILQHPSIRISDFVAEIQKKYGQEVDATSLVSAVDVLQGKFVSKSEEYERYCHIDIMAMKEKSYILRMAEFAKRLNYSEFYRQIKDIIDVGLIRYSDKYAAPKECNTPFVLYEKYSRRDVSFLMNCGKDLSSTMYGMKRIGDDVFIFITYHKESSEDKNYVDGKPDYADAFEDNMIFRWDSQIGRGIHSSYVEEVVTAPHKHLLVKKSDAETNFYYMGEFEIMDVKSASKKDNNGKERDITKFVLKMHHGVRDDLLRYLQSNIEILEEQAG